MRFGAELRQTGSAELSRLVGNSDAYAVQGEDGRYTPVREPLTRDVLRDHVVGRKTVGTYVVRPPDQARTLVFDVDADPDEADRQVEVVADVLDQLGLEYGVEASGRKGYHVWVVAADYMPAEVLYRLGRGVRDEAGLPMLEVFPKQRQVRDLGNLVKLPGGIHRVTGQRSDFLTPFPATNACETLVRAADLYPEVTARSFSTDGVEFPCMASIQLGVPEGSRNIHLFHLATMLYRSGLTAENVERVLNNVNRECLPPLDDAEILNIVKSSGQSGPICDQIDSGRQCGDACVKRRAQTGLHTTPGALRWAAEGELAVIFVESRTDDGLVIELGHPDLVQGRAVLRHPGRQRND